MPIFENNRIRVTLTDEQSAAWNHGRAKILSRAMEILGNRSEAQCMESDVYSDEDYIAEGLSAFVSDYIVEKFPDNCGEILMRMRENRRLSPGMVRGITAANAIASSKPREEIISRGKQSIEFSQKTEKNYRHRFDKNDWKIEIVGDMPEQIGMCRYKNFSFKGFEVIEATVKPHSTSAHVGLPKKWTGCRVAVVRLDEGSESTEPNMQSESEYWEQVDRIMGRIKPGTDVQIEKHIGDKLNNSWTEEISDEAWIAKAGIADYLEAQKAN